MRRLITLTAVLVLTAGCGGGGGGGTDGGITAAQMGSSAELQAAMKKAGVTCDGTPGPPEKRKLGHVLSFGVVPIGDDDKQAFGAVPAEELKCEIGGVDVTAYRFETQSERVETMQSAENFACDIDIKDAYWVGAGPFALGTFDIEPKDVAVTKKIAKALKTKVSRFPCGYG